MKVLNDDKEKVIIEFSKREYYQLQNWLIGKEAGEIDIDVRDTLENFISMSHSMNPKDNVKDILIDDYPTIHIIPDEAYEGLSKSLIKEPVILKKGQISLRYVLYDMMEEEKLTFKDLAKIANDSTSEIEGFIRGHRPNYCLEKKELLINHFNLDKNNFIDFNCN